MGADTDAVVSHHTGDPLSRSPGPRLLRLWRRLSPLPGGKWLFARIFRRMVPYSGSVAPTIEHLEPGYARVGIPDRRANRQHLGSVHAIALLNVAEQASGLAMICGLPEHVRGIVISISMTYLKKARGPIIAVSHVPMPLPAVTANTDFEVAAECLDREDNIVARATVTWRLGPVR